MFLSSQNKVFREDRNYIKEMQFNWESFIIVRDKQNSCRNTSLLKDMFFDLFLT